MLWTKNVRKGGGITSINNGVNFLEKEELKCYLKKHRHQMLQKRIKRVYHHGYKNIIWRGGLDGLTVAGGVGEKGIETRERGCKYLEPFGIKIDTELNNIKGKERKISTED